MVLHERAKHYRALAAEAATAAASLPSGDLREGWLKIARDWIELADDVERAVGTEACSPDATDDETIPGLRGRLGG